MKTLQAAAAAVVFGIITTGCGGTEFKSGNNRKAADAIKPTDPVHKTLSLQCENGKGEARLTTSLVGDQRTNVRIEGEFCGVPESSASGSLTVMFIVDRSGSMEANDPLDGNSCGRLKAAEALVAKLSAANKPGVTINVAMQPFGDLATAGIAPAAIDDFKASLTKENFCDNNDGATNYEAAFKSAKDTLSSIVGPKAVYFISDGLPTRAGNDPFGSIGFPGSTSELLAEVQKAGLEAAGELRQLSDLTLNAVYLKGAEPAGGSIVVTNPTLPDGAATDPQAYLEKITGAKERVRLVTDADALAAEIVTFDTPEVIGLDKGSASGTISAASFGKNTVKIATLEKDASREGVWRFTTEPFALFGNQGASVDNEVTLTIKASDGKSYSATVNVAFKIQSPAAAASPAKP